MSNNKPAAPTHSVKSDQEALLDIFGGPVPVIAAPAFPQPVVNNNLDSLFSNTFDVVTSASPPVTSNTTTPTNSLPPFVPILSLPNADAYLNAAVFSKNNDVVIYDAPQSLQITARCEYKQNLSRVTLTFVNKSPHTFQNFSVVSSLTSPTDILRVVLKPADSNQILPNGGQLQQIINLECTNDFANRPEVTCQFRWAFYYL